MLTRPEAKVIDERLPPASAQPHQGVVGCGVEVPLAARSGSRKYGVYGDDRILSTGASGCALPIRVCLEAQVMDWADDVAYSVHDIDDAIQLGLFDPLLLRDQDERDGVIARCRSWYLPEVDPAAVDDALRRLERQDCWVDPSMRIHPITGGRQTDDERTVGRFSAAAEVATRQRFGLVPSVLRRRRSSSPTRCVWRSPP